MKTLQEIKNDYAQEQGYEDWNELRKELYGDITELKIESYMNEICLRAQKEALKKAAKNTSFQYVRPKTFHYKEIEYFITNPENLIR